MKKFNYFLTGILLVLIIWLAYIIAGNTILRPQYDNDIKITTIATDKTAADNNIITISKDEFDATMQKVAYATRLEAQNEYDKSFSILLTILTIFGIAWPVIIALLQFKFNEKEMEKISKAESKINELKTEFETGTKNISATFAFSFEALACAHDSNINIYANDPANKRIAIINYIAMQVNAITRYCEAENTEMARNLIMRLYNKQLDFGDIGKIDEFTIKNVESLKNDLGTMYYDIFKTVYNKYFVQQLP